MDILRNHPGNIPDHWGRQSGSKWVSFPEWSPSRNGVLCLLCQQSDWLALGRDVSHGDRRSTRDSLLLSRGDRNSKRDSILLPWDFFSKKRRRASQISHNFAVRTPLRQLKQTRFCWFSNKWQVTVIVPSSTTTLTEYRNCPNPWLQQCVFLIGNQKTSNCLKICFKQVSTFTTNPRKKTEYVISTLSCVVMLCTQSKTSAAPAMRTWLKSWLYYVEKTQNTSQWLRQNTNFND